MSSKQKKTSQTAATPVKEKSDKVIAPVQKKEVLSCVADTLLLFVLM